MPAHTHCHHLFSCGMWQQREPFMEHLMQQHYGFFHSLSTSEAGLISFLTCPEKLCIQEGQHSVAEVWLKCVQFNFSSGDDLWLLLGPCLFPFHDIFNVTLLISESNLKCCFDLRQKGLSVITIDIILQLNQFIFSAIKTLTLLWLVSIHPQPLLFLWNHIRWWSYEDLHLSVTGV